MRSTSAGRGDERAAPRVGDAGGSGGGGLLGLVDASAELSRTPEGYLDALRTPVDPPRSRSQSLWTSRIGPAVYSRAIQPAVRALAGPPGPHALAAGLRLGPGDSVLDLGCGPGEITAAFGEVVGPGGAVIGVDVSTTMLALAAGTHGAANVRFLRAGLEDVPFTDGRFDAVCAAAVLMLVDSPRRALAEMMRLVRPAGRLAVVVPVRGTGPAGVLGRAVGRMAGGRMFAPTEVGDLVAELGADRVVVQGNGLVEVTYARRCATDGDRPRLSG